MPSRSQRSVPENLCPIPAVGTTLLPSLSINSGHSYTRHTIVTAPLTPSGACPSTNTSLRGLSINSSTYATSLAGGGTTIPTSSVTSSTSGNPVCYTNGTGAVGACAVNPSRGTAALSSGTVTVSTSAACAVSSTCVYKLSHCGIGSSTAIGTLSTGTITAGTSFVINALSSAAAVATGDLSTVCWQIN